MSSDSFQGPGVGPPPECQATQNHMADSTSSTVATTTAQPPSKLEGPRSRDPKPVLLLGRVQTLFDAERQQTCSNTAGQSNAPAARTTRRPKARTRPRHVTSKSAECKATCSQSIQQHHHGPKSTTSTTDARILKAAVLTTMATPTKVQLRMSQSQ